MSRRSVAAAGRGEQLPDGDRGGELPRRRRRADPHGPRREHPSDRVDHVCERGPGRCERVCERVECVDPDRRDHSNIFGVDSRPSDPVAHRRCREPDAFGDSAMPETSCSSGQSCADGLDGVNASRVGNPRRQDLSATAGPASAPSWPVTDVALRIDTDPSGARPSPRAEHANTARTRTVECAGAQFGVDRGRVGEEQHQRARPPV
jgi:hypothetical protein